MRKKYFAAIIGTVLVLILLGAAVRLFPLIHAAVLLGDISKHQGFRYEISIEPQEENLTESQKQLTGSLVWVLGNGESSSMSFRIAGRVSEGKAYGQVFFEGQEEPVTELYFQQGEGLLNVKMLYDSIQQNLTAQHPLLGAGLPEWEYGEFLSSAQIEKIFQIDFSELFHTEELTENHTHSFWQSLRMLIGMKSRKGADGGRQFEAELGEYHVLLEIKREGQYPAIDIAASNRAGNQAPASYTGTFIFQETEKIIFPDSLADDKDIQQFADFWSVMGGLQNMLPEL